MWIFNAPRLTKLEKDVPMEEKKKRKAFNMECDLFCAMGVSRIVSAHEMIHLCFFLITAGGNPISGSVRTRSDRT